MVQGNRSDGGATLPDQPHAGAPGIVLPPAPPGESPSEAVDKTRAVGEALTRLGYQADPQQVAEQVRAAHGIELSVAEAAAIQAQLLERIRTPPEPDRPPPQEARRRFAAVPDEEVL
ncbi:MAG TPA: hypothetical protein VNK04_17355 [Gemmataceae bacterium]|nr:hypothetical protein [Gemmataceae bacterium]